MEDNLSPLGAIGDVSRALDKFRDFRPSTGIQLAEEAPSELDLRIAFSELANTLRSAKPVIGTARSGFGLATFWWQRLVREMEALEAAFRQCQAGWTILLFEREELFEWLQLDAINISVALTSIAHGAINGPTVAGLLDDDGVTAIDKLRKLADDWEAEFADAPTEPTQPNASQDISNAWRPWERRRNELLNIAGRYVINAVNSAQIDAEHFKDERFGNLVLRQLATDYQNPEQGLIRQFEVKKTPAGLRLLADWLAGSELEQVEVDSLRASFVRCRERLVAAKAKHRALSALLIHQSLVGNSPEPARPDLFVAQGMHGLNLRGGPHCDPQQILDEKGKPSKLFPGASRTYSLFGKQFPGSSNFVYSEALAEYDHAAAALGRLLDRLAPDIRQQIWCDWPFGYLKSEPTDMWTNAVFELAFQEHHATTLAAERRTWHANTQLNIKDISRFRHSDENGPEILRPLIEYVGDPPVYWYSWLADIWQASIDAIDLLVTLLPDNIALEIAEAAPETTPAELSAAAPTSTEENGADGPPESPADPLESLTPSVKKAWASWKLAEENHAETPQDRTAYAWLAEQDDELFIGELVGYDLPPFPTWGRYVRKARNAMNANKNRSRYGRADGAGSIVRVDTL